MKTKNWILLLSVTVGAAAVLSLASLKEASAKDHSDSRGKRAGLDKGHLSGLDKARPHALIESKAGNFGKTVSREAKIFRIDPVPGYRNFGQWVSCQRSAKGKCPTAAPDAPSAPVVPISGPVSPSAPTPTLPTNPAAPVPTDVVNMDPVPVAPPVASVPTSPTITTDLPTSPDEPPTLSPVPTGTLADGGLGT